MTYCFKCRACGYQLTHSSREVREVACAECGATALVRDYRAEAVGVGSGVRVSRDGTVRDQAHLFLPDNNDFKGPGDPDGTKGMRKWHERYQPAPGNKNPVMVGEIDKRVF